MRRTVTNVVLATLVGALLAIVINVATGGTLPAPFAWLQRYSWPAVGALVVLMGVITFFERRAEQESGSGQVTRSTAPAELPRDIPDFTGRHELVREVRELVERDDEKSAAVVISAISGMAGIGKTALAVHVAHLVRTRFPDGQLYVNLRGAEAQVQDPMVVLDDFLGELGMVDPPGDLESTARAYRSRLADRRMLVVLDNAADEDQVRPLLPGSPSCKVLVTSRKRLVNLAGACTVALDTLTPAEAVDLLGGICGRPRVAAERQAAEAVVRRCGHLPIAIRIAGAVLARRPRQSLARFVEQLANEPLLDVLGAEGNDDVRASFALGYGGLPADAQRQFRLLGLVSGPDFPAWVGQVALDVGPEPGVRTPLGKLTEARLLEDGYGQEDAAGQRRYRFHDLLREFAREQLTANETPGAKREALERILTTYLRLARVASRRLQPVQASEDSELEHVVDFSEDPFRRGALAWFTAERTCLVAAVEQAVETGFATTAWQLSVCLEAFFERRTHWDDWQRTFELALAAARTAGDARGAGQLLRSLGYLARERGNPKESLRLLELGRKSFQAVGDRFGEARVVCNMIRTHRDLGGFDDALRCYRFALPAAQSFGNTWLEANVRRDMGMVHRDHGNSADALDCLEAALPLFEEAGDELLATYTTRDIGMIYQQEGDHEAGVARFEDSLAGFERLGDQRGVARALNSLGVGHHRLGKQSEASVLLRRSLAMFKEIGDPRWEAYTLRSLGEVESGQALALRQRPAGARLRRRAKERDHWRAAESQLRESHRILDELDDRVWGARTLLSLGEMYLDRAEPDQAAECLRRCLEAFRSMGNSKGEADTRILLGRALSDLGQDEPQPADASEG